jgi:hypothetical protein
MDAAAPAQRSKVAGFGIFRQTLQRRHFCRLQRNNQASLRYSDAILGNPPGMPQNKHYAVAAVHANVAIRQAVCPALP